MPKENIDLIREAGFVRALVPAAAGGDERDLWDYCDAVRLITKACPATGWVTGVLNVHQAAIPHFDVSVQKEVWATGVNTIISSSGTPVMKAKLAEGGVTVSGRGRWSSGCDHAEWAMVGVKVPDLSDSQYPQRKYRDYMFMAHKSEYSIDQDTWYSMGQRGSGSKDLVFDNLFVPYRRMEPLSSLSFGTSGGAGTIDSWIARTPFVLIFSTFLPSIALGCAEGMIEEFTKRQRTRKNNLTGAYGILNAAGHMRLAESAHELESLQLFFRHLQELIQGIGERSERLDESVYMGTLAKLTFITARATNITDRLFEAAGASAIADFSIMQRYWRDGKAARLHVGSDFDSWAQHHGRLLLGMPPTADL